MRHAINVFCIFSVSLRCYVLKLNFMISLKTVGSKNPFFFVCNWGIASIVLIKMCLQSVVSILFVYMTGTANQIIMLMSSCSVQFYFEFEMCKIC